MINNPIAVSMPLDRAYLRPLQQPLFDRVIYPKRGTDRIVAFETPIGRPFNNGDGKKTELDTNLYQEGMLDYPREFSILGFNVVFDPRAKKDDVDELRARGMFEFIFLGRRPYAAIPLMLLPMVKFHDPATEEEFKSFDQIVNEFQRLASKAKTETEQKVASALINGAGDHMEELIRKQSSFMPYHRFNLGRGALKIDPGEKFSSVLSFGGSPSVSKDVGMMVVITGLYWMPL